MRLGLTISRLAVAVVCNFVIRSSAEPSFDSKFSASDLSALQQLLQQYSAKLAAADFQGAWSLLAPNAKVTFTNKILGGTPETASTQAEFVAIYKKASFEGKLTQSLLKATLLSTSPFSVQLDGTVSSDKGPLPNTPANFLTKWVFTGDHPGPGKIVSVDDQIVSLASSTPSPKAQSPSSSSSTSQVPPPPSPPPNQSPAKATPAPSAATSAQSGGKSAPVKNPSPAKAAPVPSAATSAPSGGSVFYKSYNETDDVIALQSITDVAQVQTSAPTQASPSSPSIDSKILAADQATLLNIFATFASNIASGKFADAWSIFAPNAKITAKNQLLGDSDTITNKDAFVKYYTKNSFGGQLKLSLSSVTLNAATPFTVSVTGLLTLTSGPLPNTPIDFSATYVFSGAHPVLGQVQSLDQTVVGISSAKSAGPSNAPVGTPSSSVSATTSAPAKANPSAPTIDSKITGADQATLLKIFAGFASNIASGRFADAWSIFAPNAKITAQNQILGDSDTITDKDGFVKYYTKNSFGGQLKLALSTVTLQAASPFTVSVTGTITLTSGPLPNTPIDFSATYTFTGAHPADGQVKSLDQKVIGISKGSPQSGAAGGSPSLGAAAASFGGFSIPNFHELAGGDIGGITGILLKYGAAMQSGNYPAAYNVFGPRCTIVFQNDLTGGAVEYLRNAQKFAAAFRKSSFGGKLTLNLTDVYRLKAPTFSIGLRGWVKTNAGPTANLAITFWGVITFSGKEPQEGQIRYYSLELQGLADGSQLASHIPGIVAPQIDPRIRPVDAVRIEGLLLQFGQQVQGGDFGAAYDILQPAGFFGGVTQMIYQNDITGGEILNVANKFAFVAAFQQSTYGGRLSQTLAQIRLVSTYPLVFIFYGLLSTSAGPTANVPIRYSCTVAFRGRQAIAGQIQSFYLTVESFADGLSLSSHIPGLMPPFMDPAISFHDAVRIEGLILSYGQKILQRDYVGAYNVFGRNYIAENKNDLLNTQDSSQNAYDYARAFDKDAFGGRVTSTLRSINLVSQNPYTVVFDGQLQTTAGQAPNENLDYRSTLVFQGNSPHGGQVVRFSTEVIRFSDGSTPFGHILKKVPVVGGLLHGLIP